MTEDTALNQVRDAAMRQLKTNIKAYKAMQADLERKHIGQVALMHDGELAGVYNDSWDAHLVGYDKFGQGNFSVTTIGQVIRVDGRPLHLKTIDMD